MVMDKTPRLKTRPLKDEKRVKSGTGLERPLPLIQDERPWFFESKVLSYLIQGAKALGPRYCRTWRCLRYRPVKYPLIQKSIKKKHFKKLEFDPGSE